MKLKYCFKIKLWFSNTKYCNGSLICVIYCIECEVSILCKALSLKKTGLLSKEQRYQLCIALNPFLFVVIMDRLTDEVRREPPWTMMFADDIGICGETREEVKWRLECWRYALERREMNVSRSKTKYLCVNGRNDKKTVKMEDTKVSRIKEFKYLG